VTRPADVGRATAQVERVFREAYGQAVATLVRAFGDITLAEDAVQDAFVVASDRWPREGIPPNAAGWIVTTARRRAVDVLRRTARGRELHQQAGEEAARRLGADAEAPEDEALEDESPVKDDQLRLIFTCCHPALSREHQVALTLRLLGGLSVEEVARAFLVSETAMAKRLVRAKYKIKAARTRIGCRGTPTCPTGSERSSPSCISSTTRGRTTRTVRGCGTTPSGSDAPWPTCCRMSPRSPGCSP
jgi:RNA polymerase sigma factor (sigma-70 family)